ncbi:MAG: hypothetical protein DMF63_01875 [Acidobacteria bacterium]|nr:MAG: hypothetical protein DMF63_01875 [Acidobacteriota bacterium]
MDRRARAKLDFWIEAGGILIFCALVAAWFIVSSNEPLDAEGLAIHAGDIRSFSAAGALLSDEFSHGDLTDTFFHEQIELIDDKVEDIGKTLGRSDVRPESKSDAEQLKTFADRAHTTFENARQKDNIKSDELRQLAGLAKALEDNLRKEAEK